MKDVSKKLTVIIICTASAVLIALFSIFIYQRQSPVTIHFPGGYTENYKDVDKILNIEYGKYNDVYVSVVTYIDTTSSRAKSTAAVKINSTTEKENYTEPYIICKDTVKNDCTINKLTDGEAFDIIRQVSPESLITPNEEQIT